MRYGHFPLDAHTCWWCTQSPVSVHTPQLVPMVSGPPRCALPPPPVLWIWSPYPHTSVGMQMGGWLGGEETGAVAAGKLPKVPPRVFFFLGKSSCSILWLPLYKEGPILSHSPPLQLDRGLSGSGSHRAQLSILPSQRPQSLWVYHFVLIPLSATSSNQVSHGVAEALFGKGGSR